MAKIPKTLRSGPRSPKKQKVDYVSLSIMAPTLNSSPCPLLVCLLFFIYLSFWNPSFLAFLYNYSQPFSVYLVLSSIIQQLLDDQLSFMSCTHSLQLYKKEFQLLLIDMNYNLEFSCASKRNIDSFLFLSLLGMNNIL